MRKKAYYPIRKWKGMRTTLQRIVWLREYGEIPRGHDVHHINGNIFDNRLSNLRLMSRAEHTRLHFGNYKRVQGRLMKRCRACRVFKPLGLFYSWYQLVFRKNKNGRVRKYRFFYFSARCKACRIKQVIVYQRKQKEAS